MRCAVTRNVGSLVCYNGSHQNVFTIACWFAFSMGWTQSLEADGQNFSCFSSFPSSSALLLPLPFLLPLFLSPHPILLLHFLLHCFYLPLPRPPLSPFFSPLHFLLLHFLLLSRAKLRLVNKLPPAMYYRCVSL